MLYRKLISRSCRIVYTARCKESTAAPGRRAGGDKKRYSEAEPEHEKQAAEKQNEQGKEETIMKKTENRDGQLKFQKAAALLGAAVLALGAVGCGSRTGAAGTGKTEAVTEKAKAAENENTENAQAAGRENAKGEALKGSITLAGSTSMEKFANALAEAFMEKYPDVTVQAEFTGSSAGIEEVLAGQCDVGNSSRNLKEEEKGKGAVENIVAIDGIAVVTDPSNEVTDLSKEQLIEIYTGKVTNWEEAGGADLPVVVVGREAGSGTRGAFEEILGVEDTCKYANELDSTGAVMAKVASTPGAIGYVSLDVVDDSVKALALDGAEASEENIKAGSYLLSRPFVMATKGEISEQSSLVQALFDYVYSAEGSELVKSVGLITVD